MRFAFLALCALAGMTLAPAAASAQLPPEMPRGGVMREELGAPGGEIERTADLLPGGVHLFFFTPAAGEFRIGLGISSTPLHGELLSPSRERLLVFTQGQRTEMVRVSESGRYELRIVNATTKPGRYHLTLAQEEAFPWLNWLLVALALAAAGLLLWKKRRPSAPPPPSN